RTSAMADVYAPLRAGSDVVLLGALVKFVLERLDELFSGMAGRPRERWSARERFFHDFLTRYTNAPTLINQDFKDTEDFGGLFSGFSEQTRKYDSKSWRYDSGMSKKQPDQPGQPESFAERVGRLIGPPPEQDPTLKNERCVYRILHKHYER